MPQPTVPRPDEGRDMRGVGLLLLVLGILLLTAGLALGLPFTGVFLMGFLGTGGREAGRELALFLPLTLGACGLGWALIRAGRWLRPSAPREPAVPPASAPGDAPGPTP